MRLIDLTLASSLLSLTACDPSLEGAPRLLDCSLTGEFSVELGQDRGAGFERLLADEEPELTHGLQGGTHLLLAGRLRTPDPLDAYEVELRAEAGLEPCDEGGCAGWTELGAFGVVLDSSYGQVTVLGPDEVVLTPLFLVVEGWESAPVRRLSLTVSDPCERRASSQRLLD